jgi:hypothetical protein
MSQGIRVAGLRQARYVGEAKVHLQHVATAVALKHLAPRCVGGGETDGEDTALPLCCSGSSKLGE